MSADINSSLLNLLLGPDSLIPSPAFVIDTDKLRRNAQILASVQEKTGAKILLALKAYAAWATFPLLSRSFHGPLWGTCASSVDEARLGREEFGGEVHAFAAAWNKAEIEELVGIADHIVFNSLDQWRSFRDLINVSNSGARRNNPVKSGLRINPEHSEGAKAIYNPCAQGSRLGIRKKQLAEVSTGDLAGISGLHFHTLCEQGADALQRTLAAFGRIYDKFPLKCEWLNFGGGHHITRKDYDIDLLCCLIQDWQNRTGAQIYLEPGEAVALDAGWLVATVLDIVEADLPVVILDTSAACHMPDVLEMPYVPEVWLKQDGKLENAAPPGEKKWTCRLAGKSCLAGDVIGAYSLDAPLARGGRLAFADMAIYSMVKTNTFNGIRLPPIYLYDPDFVDKFRLLVEPGYAEFKSRLS